jgi:uncharacterized membrane protein YccC
VRSTGWRCSLTTRPVPHGRAIRLGVPDWLPALVNAARAFVAIGAFALFWIIAAWPNGASAITFAALSVILFAPRADQAHAGAMSFAVGAGLAAAFAGLIKFAVLPNLETFVAFAFVFGLVLVPAGALMAQPSTAAIFTPVAVYFCVFVAPTNPISFDGQQFYNAALATLAGVVGAALSFRLLPPLAPALRTRRLLALRHGHIRRRLAHPAADAQHLRGAQALGLERGDPGGVDRRRAALVDAPGLGRRNSLHLGLAADGRLKLGENAKHLQEGSTGRR